MKINFNHIKQKIYTHKEPPKIPIYSAETPAKPASKLLVGAMLALMTLGVCSSCSEKTKKDSQGIEYYIDNIDNEIRANYIDSIKNPNHTVSSGESLYNIAKEHGVTPTAIKNINNIKDDNIIYPNQILKIPNSIRVKNVKTIKDASLATGLSTKYLKELEQIENPDDIREIFLDKNNNKTVGVGHKLSADEIKKYEKRSISDAEKYTLLVEDILSREKNIKEIINPIIYDNLPNKLRENVFDFVFHRGETSFENNKALIDGLNNADYQKAVANLHMNYTVVTNAKGEKNERHLAGLCKRSLIRMGNASRIFKKGIPDEVINSAQKTYKEGLELLQVEFGETNAYENIKAEYMDIAYNLFDGKIGAPAQTKALTKTNDKINTEKKSLKIPTTATNVYVNGQKIKMTKEEIEADWNRTAQRYARSAKRPELCLDKNGNVTAYVKEYNPKTKNGELSNKVIIVNQGHGGCAAHEDSPKNTAFDPGACNSIMEPILDTNGKFKRNSNGELILKESNKFIGNNGKALEEWEVNKNFSKDLIKKLTMNGAKVIFISGEVHNAQNAIRQYEKRHRVNLFISLHSNSSETIKTAIDKYGKEYISERIAPRGFFIMPNIRGGEDKEDLSLAKKINNSLHNDSWLSGLGDIRGKSLGVLSSSSNQTSSVPGVLIETGNLKNPIDVTNLNSKDFRKRVIDATYNGIVEYLNND